MKKYFNACTYTLLIGLVLLGTVSCRKSEPAPEIVTNPLDETAYYLIGKVTEKNAALADVTVSVTGAETKTAQDGTFQLKVDKKGDYTVSFAKTSYITVTSVATIASDAKKNSSVAITQQLMKTNPPVTVDPDKETVVAEANNPNLSIAFPAGAVKTATPISVTEYTEGAKKAAAGQTRASLATINCVPDGLTFEKPVTVYLKNPTSSKAQFSSLRHYVEKNGTWTDSGEARFDTESNSYAFELMGFSNHSVGLTATQTLEGTASEPLTVVEIDNLGSVNAKEQEISVTQKFGWEVDGTISTLLQSALPDLSSGEISSLASSVASTIASLKGSAPGIVESKVSFGTAKVSGDTKLTLTFTSNVLKSRVVFKMTYNGGQKDISIPLKTYLGTSATMTYTYGNSHTEHSGGGGQ